MSHISEQVQKNKLVSITYRILSDTGDVLEQSDLPVDYVQGVDGKLFPQVEAALEGKFVGDEVQIILSPNEAFGMPDPELIISCDINSAPPKYRVIGARPTFQNENGDTLEMVVTKIKDGEITVDGNHPFAGKTITFVVKVVAVRDASEGASPMDISNYSGPSTIQ